MSGKDANGDDGKKRVAIVGGGIAGLFCAWVLGKQGYFVDLFETADRLGGRIRTVRLDRQNRELLGKQQAKGRKFDDGKEMTWTNKELNFYVEFGPMRLELDKQHLLKALLNFLEILPEEEGDRKLEKAKPFLVPFPSYASPSSEHDPRYELRPEEEGKSPLDLMILAFARILSGLEIRKEDGAGLMEKQTDLKNRLQLAAALSEPITDVFLAWVKKLTPQDYWQLQTASRFTMQGHCPDQNGNPEKAEVELYRLGFWNLLSIHLSHDALNKVRDLGTFYHLLPENPNAAEWLTWWMIGLSASDNMEGIFGGMECIIDKMREKIESLGNVNFKFKHWVLALKKEEGKKKLQVAFKQGVKGSQAPPISEHSYGHVILAVPRRAAQQIQKNSQEIFDETTEFESLLESCFGFPMVKTFVVLKERWWEKNNMANSAATRMPTRELHYWKPQHHEDRQGLIMAYTDRPASAFWADYVPSGAQIDANRGKPGENEALEPKQDSSSAGQKTNEGQAAEDQDERTDTAGVRPLTKDLRIMMLERMAAYLDVNNGGETRVKPRDIAWYGIRDWGRAPFSGANHSWRPGRRYWTVMRRLADLPVKDCSAKVHVCGEAYSDYHGFIEGPLRSAAYVLHRILEPNSEPDTKGPFSTFLQERPKTKGNDEAQAKDEVYVEKEYLEGLRLWARNLDKINPPKSAEKKEVDKEKAGKPQWAVWEFLD